jgi:hypothetical protein
MGSPEAVIRAAISLETGGLGPKADESAQQYVERVTKRVVSLLRRHGHLPEEASR